MVEPPTVPWYAVCLVVVTGIGSAFVATVNIGAGYAALELPAVLTYALPALLHLTAAGTTWRWARSTDAAARNKARQAINALAAILFVVGALTAQLRHEWNTIAIIVPGMTLIGLLSAIGPVLLVVFFFPHRHATG